MTRFGFPDLATMLEKLNLRVAKGKHADVGEYPRDLVRREQRAASSEVASVRAKIEEGEASGYIEAEPSSIIEGILARRKAGRAMPKHLP